MAVYFVYRCHYGAPSEKHVRRFEYDTVLEWAQAVWKQFDTYEAASEYAEELLGGLRVYSIGDLFYTRPEDGPSRGRPETMENVHEWFTSMYGDVSANGPHHVQWLTDDDEIDMAVLCSTTTTAPRTRAKQTSCCSPTGNFRMAVPTIRHRTSRQSTPI